MIVIIIRDIMEQHLLRHIMLVIEMMGITITDYGDEYEIIQATIGEQNKLIQKIDSDHVQKVIMYQVHENDDYW
jgi:hypothetical protein